VWPTDGEVGSARCRLSQNVVRRNGHGRKSERCNRVPAGHGADAGVAAAPGLAAHLNTISFEVHEPGLWNADAGVEGKLDVAVIRDRGIGDLNLRGERRFGVIPFARGGAEFFNLLTARDLAPMFGPRSVPYALGGSGT